MEANYMSIMAAGELAKNPDLMKQDVETISAACNKAAAEQREIAAKNAARKPKTPATAEYDGLRRQKFALTEEVKNTETYTSTMTDQARGTNERAAVLLKRKMAARAAGQIHDERHLENQVRVLETDVAEYEKNAENGRKAHQRAKAALAGFDHARLAELEKELDA
jgi:hypothetical protein